MLIVEDGQYRKTLVPLHANSFFSPRKMRAYTELLDCMVVQSKRHLLSDVPVGIFQRGIDRVFSWR